MARRWECLILPLPLASRPMLCMWLPGRVVDRGFESLVDNFVLFAITVGGLKPNLCMQHTPIVMDRPHNTKSLPQSTKMTV